MDRKKNENEERKAAIIEKTTQLMGRSEYIGKSKRKRNSKKKKKKKKKLLMIDKNKYFSQG